MNNKIKISDKLINEHKLLKKARQLAGYKLKYLATKYNIYIPNSIKQNKGWVGTLLEKCLGANSGNKPQQDFPQLGIELKTIPIDKIGNPLQTTFICSVPLINHIGITWNNSYFRKKISKILWVPIEGCHSIPLPMRRVGYPFIWIISKNEDQMLFKDWTELMDMIVLGNINKITSNYGTYIQVRTKASNNYSITKAIGKNGQKITHTPLAFYFRRKFTKFLITNYLDIF